MSRAPLDLSLYLVTDTGMTRRHGLSTTIRAAVAGGATVVQLRDPDASDEEFVALGLLARRALDGARSAAPLIVNDRVHLAERIGADGAHVGQSDLAPEAARAMLAAARACDVGTAQTILLQHLDSAAASIAQFFAGRR